MKAETGMLQTPGARNHRKRSLPQSIQSVSPCQLFLTSGLQNCDKVHLLVKKRRERRREYKLPKVYENITFTY